MTLNWQTFLSRLESYPTNTHLVRPPIPHARRVQVEAMFEQLPDALADMVNHFNGAKLFVHGMPMLRLFGLSENPALPALEWGDDWYIDKFTPKWRNAGDGRESQFAIGMTNYGGLIVFENGRTKEWDTAEHEWAPSTYELGEWLENVLQDGDAFLRELNSE